MRWPYFNSVKVLSNREHETFFYCGDGDHAIGLYGV